MLAVVDSILQKVSRVYRVYSFWQNAMVISKNVQNILPNFIQFRSIGGWSISVSFLSQISFTI